MGPDQKNPGEPGFFQQCMTLKAALCAHLNVAVVAIVQALSPTPGALPVPPKTGSYAALVSSRFSMCRATGAGDRLGAVERACARFGAVLGDALADGKRSAAVGPQGAGRRDLGERAGTGAERYRSCRRSAGPKDWRNSWHRTITNRQKVLLRTILGDKLYALWLPPTP